MELTALTVARTLADDIDAGNTLRSDNFEAAEGALTSSARSDTTGRAHFYLTFATNNGPRTFLISVRPD